MAKTLLLTICPALLLVLCGCLARQAGLAKQQTDEQVEKEIRQLESEIMAAIRQKDTERLQAILTDDFVYRNPLQGESSRTAFLANIGAITLKIGAIWSDDIKVNVYGNVAVLTGVQKASVQVEPSKEAVGATAFTDVFVRRNGRWQLALAYGVELPSVPQSK